MSNELTPLQAFQERVSEKIRKDIGEMLPEDVVKALFDKAVDETFFKPRTISSGYDRKELPSWFIEEITKAGKPILEKAIVDYVETHKEVIQTAISQFLTAQNITLLTVAAMNQGTQNQIWEVANNIMSQLRSR
jgi:hypothetical protein